MSDPDAAGLQRLLDLEAIRDLPRRYALAFDRRDAAALEALWEPADDRVAYPDMNLQTVRRDFPLAWTDGGETMLLVANHVVDLAGDEATGTVYCIAQLHQGGAFVEQSLVYEDRYVRTAGGWRFRTRRHLLWFGQERTPDPLAQPPARWPRSQVGRGVLYDRPT